MIFKLFRNFVTRFSKNGIVLDNGTAEPTVCPEDVLDSVVISYLLGRLDNLNKYSASMGRVSMSHVDDQLAKIRALRVWVGTLEPGKVRKAYERWLAVFERGAREAHTELTGPKPTPAEAKMREYAAKSALLCKKKEECMQSGTVPKPPKS